MNDLHQLNYLVFHQIKELKNFDLGLYLSMASIEFYTQECVSWKQNYVNRT